MDLIGLSLLTQFSDAGYEFDICFTSVAEESNPDPLDSAGCHWPNVAASGEDLSALNEERHIESDWPQQGETAAKAWWGPGQRSWSAPMMSRHLPWSRPSLHHSNISKVWTNWGLARWHRTRGIRLLDFSLLAFISICLDHWVSNSSDKINTPYNPSFPKNDHHLLGLCGLSIKNFYLLHMCAIFFKLHCSW